MRTRRWQYLDRPKPVFSVTETEQPSVQPPAESQTAPAGPVEPPPHPVLQQARGLYHLKQFQACADLLAAFLATQPPTPGVHRLLGLALGRLDEPDDAEPHLVRALEDDAADALARAALLSLQLEQGRVPERLSHDPEGALGELAGAAAWLEGQNLLAAGRAREAAGRFEAAGQLFARWGPPEARAERLAASLIGAAISHLLARHLDAAQACFSRMGAGSRLPEAVEQFARELYAVAEAARKLDAAEQRVELAPLAQVITGSRLRVRFYDGTRAVAMRWEGLVGST